MTVDHGKLRAISFAGTEIIRAISAPVRDENWGTIPEHTISETVEETPSEVVWCRTYRVGDGLLDGEIVAKLSDCTLDVQLRLTPKRNMRTNRAGFCILHPLVGVEGQSLAIQHPDGRLTSSQFPTLIRPDQPAKDIAGLKHRAGPVEVDITFEGDTFEMEDQRNWSDASFKTYCRPLGLPFPYALAAGTTVVQRIVARFNPASGGTESTAPPQQTCSVVMPEILLAIEPGWWGGTLPTGAGLLLRMGKGIAWSKRELVEVTRTGAAIDLECVLPDDQDPVASLSEMAELLKSAGIAPRHVIALPQTYLKSYQPSGPWPSGIGLPAAAAAAAKQFSGARLGVGVLTNFTELNRCQPVSGVGDFITHGNSAIVHEADDVSVWQTLEALPSIFSSAKAIGGSRSYRLGLCAIAMRSNPYGASLSPNPTDMPCTMTDYDPRQRTSFAAAYAIAVAALAAKAGAEAVALCTPCGPFGLVGPEGPRPINAAVSALASIGKRRADVSMSEGVVVICSGETNIYTNASPKARACEIATSSKLWDGQSVADVRPGNITIPSGGVLISQGGPL